MIRGFWLLICFVFMLGNRAALAQTPLLWNRFDDSDDGWTAMGSNMRVSVNHQTTWNGSGALKFEYDIKPGVMGAMVLPTPNGLPATARAIQLWVYADHPTTVAVLLQEKGGARYLAPFAVPERQWQKAALATSDFVAMEGPGNPSDSNGRLDVEEVGMVVVADAGQLLGISANEDAARMLGITPGPHTLYMDDFMVTAQTLPTTVVAEGADVRLDTFSRPQVGWLGLGGVSISRTEGRPLAGPGIRIDFHEAPGRLSALVRMIPAGKLAGMGRLTFSAAAADGAMLVVQLEEKGGGKFSTTVDVPGGREAREITIAFADLNPTDDSRVKDRRLNPDLVNQIVVIDAAGMAGIESVRESVVWLGDLRARPAR